MTDRELVREKIADLIIKDYLTANDTPLDTADRILALFPKVMSEEDIDFKDAPAWYSQEEAHAYANGYNKALSSKVPKEEKDKEIAWGNDNYNRLLAESRQKDKEIDRLRAFADFILIKHSWDGSDIGGGDAQDKAIELEIVELRPIDEEQSIDGEKEHYFTKWTPKPKP